MRLGDPLADGQAQPGPGPLARAGTRQVGAPEAVEDVGQVARRDADAGVGDAEGHQAVLLSQLDAHAAPAGGVLDGVLDQVEHQLPDATLVYVEHERLLGRGDVHGHARFLGQQLSRFLRLPHQLAQVHRLALQGGATLVRARQREQSVHELGHALGFLEHFGERLQRLAWQVGRGDRALHAGAHDGEWGLELVARVGRKAVQRGEAVLQPAHHLVERDGEPPQLVLFHRHR